MEKKKITITENDFMRAMHKVITSDDIKKLIEIEPVFTLLLSAVSMDIMKELFAEDNGDE